MWELKLKNLFLSNHNWFNKHYSDAEDCAKWSNVTWSNSLHVEKPPTVFRQPVKKILLARELSLHTRHNAPTQQHPMDYKGNDVPGSDVSTLNLFF